MILLKGFVVNKVFFDISKFFHKKLAIMKIYENKISNHPFLRSLETIDSIANS